MARKIPTQEQIKKVDEITKTLGIDFPQSSKDFTYKKYKRFIFLHQSDYEKKCQNINKQTQEKSVKVAKENSENIVYCTLWKKGEVKHFILEKETLAHYLSNSTEQEIDAIISALIKDK